MEVIGRETEINKSPKCEILKDSCNDLVARDLTLDDISDWQLFLERSSIV